MPKQAASAIPVGTQFSPDLIDLESFLAKIVANTGNKAALENEVWKPGVRIRQPTRSPTKRRRSLPLEAAVQYGLLEPSTYNATPLAVRLAKLKPPDLYEEFAKHILIERGGLRVVEAVQQMQMDGIPVTGDSLAEYLTDQGFRVTVHNTAVNSMRMWLSKAGLFPERGWDVDVGRKSALVGLSDERIAALVGMTPEQQAFLLALCRINPSGQHPAAEVRNLAETILGRRFARASLPKAVLDELKSAGLIDYTTKGTRGGKTATLRTTPQFRKDVLEPFVEHAIKDLDAVLTDYYRKSPAEIYAQLESSNTATKGRALEAYAVHIMRLMGLRFVAWRKRAKDSTGQAEVDVVMAGLVGGLPTRWQVQCKNTPSGRVSLEDVAKEVGLLPITKATHLMVVANCLFTGDAKTYANEVMRNNPVMIFLLEKKDFEVVRNSPGSFPLILQAKAEQISQLRRGESMWGS